MAYGVLFFTGQHGVTNGVDRDIYSCIIVDTDAYIVIDRQIKHNIKRPFS